MKKLRPYQRDMLRYMMRERHPALFVEMRLGKTLVTIRRVKTYADCKNILVVAPYSALYAWEKELTEEKESMIYKLAGTHDQRAQELEALEILFKSAELKNKRHWALLNQEGHLTLPEVADFPWDVVILDESTFIKTPYKRKKDKETKISYYAPRITFFYVNKFRDVKHRIILTGTPAPESELDYFMQLKFLDDSILQFKNFYHFRGHYFRRYGYDWTIMRGAKEQLARKLAKRCFFLTRADVNLGGQKIYTQRMIELPPAARRAYDRLEREFILELDGELKSTIFATEKFTWLRRLCGGWFKGKPIHDAKVCELLALIKGELRGQSIIVWSFFTDEIMQLDNTLTEHGVAHAFVTGDTVIARRNAIIDTFQSRKLTILLAQPECFRMGIDLSAASTMIYFSTPVKSITRMQSEDRFVNVSRNDSLFVVDFVCNNTIESDVIIPSLHAKESRQQMLGRLVRRFQNVLD